MILVTGDIQPEYKLADPICTFLFSVIVLITTVSIMRDILVVLMEGTPRRIDFSEVSKSFYAVPGIKDIHNLRVWSLSLDKLALSVHIAVAKDVDPLKILKLCSIMIQRRFGITETTIQVEEYVDEMLDCTQCQDPPD
ncbi:hypothetical protein KUTeg_000483 [Tegillarca granosa]|uniref:Cation efflux protein cytoplasmic domain-containing protein n=1 Tax=Tegillarca granosa TaxID=220873 RepID=A0ABQ9FXM4_TEGGR|nr:hypothetical protein KUTeg_000483 [Tegillarca granosa]